MNSSQNFLCWFEDEQNNYLSFPSKIWPCQLFHFKKQQKIFQQHGSNCKCFVTQFFWWFQGGNTCDETTGKETEFSLVVSLEINIIIYIIYSSIQCDWEREEILFCLMISSSWSSPASCSHSWSCPATPWSWSNISHIYKFHIIPFHPQWPPDLLKAIYATLNLMFRLRFQGKAGIDLLEHNCNLWVNSIEYKMFIWKPKQYGPMRLETYSQVINIYIQLWTILKSL